MKIGTFKKYEITDETLDQKKIIETLNKFSFHSSEGKEVTGFVLDKNIMGNYFDLINSFTDDRQIAIFRFRIDTRKVNNEILKSKIQQEIDRLKKDVKGTKISKLKRNEIKASIEEEMLKTISPVSRTVKCMIDFDRMVLYIMSSSESVIDKILPKLMLKLNLYSKTSIFIEKKKDFECSFFPDCNEDFMYYLLFQGYSTSDPTIYLNNKVKFSKYDKVVTTKKESEITFDEIKKFIINEYQCIEADFLLNKTINVTWNIFKNCFSGIKTTTLENTENEDFGNEILMIEDMEEVIKYFNIEVEKYLKQKNFKEDFKAFKE